MNEKEIIKNFSDNLNMAMLNHGDTGKTAAPKFGVIAGSVNNWRKGTALPDTKNLMALADYMGVSVTEMFKADAVAPVKPNTLGGRIDFARRAMRFTIAELAEKAGVSTACVNGVISGGRINTAQLLKLCAALGDTPEYFLTGEDK